MAAGQRVPGVNAHIFERRHRACLAWTALRRYLMFAISAILIGVVGIVYVRRRNTRKKQTV
jgi:hypothetical protein